MAGVARRGLIEIPEIEAGEQRLMEEGPGFERRRRAAAEEAAALFELSRRGRAPEREPVGDGDALIIAAFQGHGVFGGLARRLDGKRMIEEEERLRSNGAHIALADGGVDIAEVEGFEELQALVAEGRSVNAPARVGVDVIVFRVLG